MTQNPRVAQFPGLLDVDLEFFGWASGMMIAAGAMRVDRSPQSDWRQPAGLQGDNDMGFYGTLRQVYKTIVPARLRTLATDRNSFVFSFVNPIKSLIWRVTRHDEIYDEKYYSEIIEPLMLKSAAVMAESIVSEFHPSFVVDVGCGTGELLRQLKERGVQVAGYEKSAGRHQARARQERGSPRVRPRAADRTARNPAQRLGDLDRGRRAPARAIRRGVRGIPLPHRGQGPYDGGDARSGRDRSHQRATQRVLDREVPTCAASRSIAR